MSTDLKWELPDKIQMDITPDERFVCFYDLGTKSEGFLLTTKRLLVTGDWEQFDLNQVRAIRMHRGPNCFRLVLGVGAQDVFEPSDWTWRYLDFAGKRRQWGDGVRFTKEMEKLTGITYRQPLKIDTEGKYFEFSAFQPPAFPATCSLCGSASPPDEWKLHRISADRGQSVGELGGTAARTAVFGGLLGQLFASPSVGLPQFILTVKTCRECAGRRGLVARLLGLKVGVNILRFDGVTVVIGLENQDYAAEFVQINASGAQATH